MVNVPQLLQRVAACGYRVGMTPEGPKLFPTRSECVMPTPLLKAMTGNREAVVAYLTQPEACRVCGRAVDAGDRERLRGTNFLCHQGAHKAFVDNDGVAHPEQPACPFRDRGK